MRANFIALLVVLAVMAAPAAAFAASPWAEQGGSYSDQVKGKLDFGAKNTLGGWTEIYTTPFRYHSDGKNWLEGTFVGIGNAVVYTVGGALHLVTFMIPEIDVPLPNNGVGLE
jgi:hypothetical protein